MTSKNTLRIETDQLIREFIKRGGAITKIKPTVRTIKTFAFPGSVANKGAKAITLRNAGFFKR